MLTTILDYNAEYAKRSLPNDLPFSFRSVTQPTEFCHFHMMVARDLVTAISWPLCAPVLNACPIPPHFPTLPLTLPPLTAQIC